MKYFELFGDKEITAAEHAAQLAAVRAAVVTKDWSRYDRLWESAAPQPVVSWTFKKPAALLNHRGELVDIEDVLNDRNDRDSEEEDDEKDGEENLLTAEQTAWLRRYMRHREARRKAGWLYDWLVLRGYIRTREQ